MDISWFVIGILVVFLLAQQAYWSFIVFKLNDKLMSRSYTDYVQASMLKMPRPVASPASESSVAVDPIAEDNARKANNLFL